MTALLGIDLGTGSVKAVVVDSDGAMIGRASAEYRIDRPHPGWAEQEPDGWWQSCVQAVRAAMSQADDVCIDAIGLSGQMHGAVLLDRTLKPLRPAIIWADTRSAVEVHWITETIGREKLIAITGSPVATGFQAASITWLQRHEPEHWSQIQAILLPKDYLRFRLTGTISSEPSDASSTLLFDVRQQAWSNRLLAELDIDPSFMPAIAGSGSVSGTLISSAAHELGLPVGIPVAGGGADAPLAALAAGVVQPEQMALTISSGSQVIVPADSFLPDSLGRIHSWRSCLADRSTGAAWYQMGATMVSGLALRWLRDTVFALDEQEAYAQMSDLANTVPAGSSGLIFLPYLAGERTPHMNPRARGLFLGLTTEHGRGHLVRSVMEGATFALLDAFDILHSLGARPSGITLSGGGAQSPLWRQIVADVFGLPVRPLQTVEQSAVGAALLAGASIGLFDPAEEALRWARYGEPVEPNPAAQYVYGQLTPLFRDAYRKHIEDFEVLAAIAG